MPAIGGAEACVSATASPARQPPLPPPPPPSPPLTDRHRPFPPADLPGARLRAAAPAASLPDRYRSSARLPALVQGVRRRVARACPCPLAPPTSLTRSLDSAAASNACPVSVQREWVTFSWWRALFWGPSGAAAAPAAAATATPASCCKAGEAGGGGDEGVGLEGAGKQSGGLNAAAAAAGGGEGIGSSAGAGLRSRAVPRHPLPSM